MKKKKNRNVVAMANGNRPKLIRHNAECYIDDLKHICEIGVVNPSRRDWIETTMLKLREQANCYEINFSSYLLKKKLKFIHQAPFIFSGKIYFADFYLPEKHCIIELDGDYHNGICQSEYDRFRDECFNGNKIKVIRIPNKATLDEKWLNTLCSDIINKTTRKKPKQSGTTCTNACQS